MKTTFDKCASLAVLKAEEARLNAMIADQAQIICEQVSDATNTAELSTGAVASMLALDTAAEHL